MTLISKKALDFKSQAAIFKDLKALVLCGLFLALYVAISTFNIRISPTIEIRFGILVLAASACYGGPLMGIVVGGAGDLLAFITGASASGPFFPGFTLTYALVGLLCGLFLYGQKMTVFRSFLASLVNCLTGIFLTTYWLVLMYSNGQNYWERLLSRLPKSICMLFVDTVLLYVILKAFQEAVVRAHLMPEHSRKPA